MDARPSERLEVPAPVPLGSIIGQDRALSTLRAAASADRIHHAWIFDGPAGVGKFTAALAFAALILDPTTAPDLSGELAPDPESEAQALLRAGSHPDLHVVTKELARFSASDTVRRAKQRSIPVDVLRQFLIEPASLKSVRKGGLAAKVFIVDEAELLAPVGQNALLKTLEEPAPGTVIILVTSAADRLLPTIRSRCNRAAFAPLSEQDMLSWLKRSELDLSSAEKDWLLRFAGGAPGQARLAAETGLLEWRAPLKDVVDRIAAGRAPVGFGAQAHQLVKEWAEAWVSSRPHASKDAANKAGVSYLVRALSADLRSRLREDVDPERIALAIELLADAQRDIEMNVQPIFALDNWAAQAVHARAYVPAT
jgi:DNA polymerase-3 subunit delta'